MILVVLIALEHPQKNPEKTGWQDKRMRTWQIIRGQRLSCGCSRVSRLESAAAVTPATLTGARWGDKKHQQ